MQRTFPDPSESPWTQPETGLIYEYVDGMWRPQDPSGGGGGGSSGGGSSNLDLGGMIIAHHVISGDYNEVGKAWTRMGSSNNKAVRHRTDLFGWDATDYDTMLIGPSYEVVTAPDKRTILSRYALQGSDENCWLDTTGTMEGPVSGWGQKYHGKANNVEGNFLFTWYLSSPWMVQLSDEEILNIINSYLDDPSPYQLKGTRRVNAE